MKRLFLSLFAGALAVSAFAVDVDGSPLAELNKLAEGSVKFDSVNGKLVATVLEAQRTFNISKDVVVDSVKLGRKFQNGVSATVMLPFKIAPGNVSGATFNRLASVDVDNARVGLYREDQFVFSYAAYIVVPEGETISFNESPVTLLATVDTNTAGNAWNNPCANNGGWRMMGTTTLKGWKNGGKYEDEIGKVYGFAGFALSEADAQNYVDGAGSVQVGQFIKVKSGVAVDPMRGYMMQGECGDGRAQNKPAVPGSEPLFAPAVSVEDLPETFSVYIVNPSVPGAGSDENGDEDVTAIKTVKTTAASKAGRWHDAAGRSLNTPKAHGVYVNDRTPVMVK
ncbi:hypothetical protein [Fibrobacter sp. UWH1]|uniref:hypothetical protein n=1 Tax=Fibrobacter sp. UWH1 TaxID=1964354 RepID=UPI000B52648B|nr:hypothetical protein [Fibrobacter sp. UWH1]OWV09212.1 hypothetical protein B7992_12420 [Fibrobacter sp. UWH1]